MSARAIVHVDMDAFYASIEQRDNTKLRGRPVIVGGLGARGVVAAASYEARRFGVHSAQPMSQARHRCPEGVFLPARMSAYRAVSRQIFDCFTQITPLVEGLSLDEAFLDVSASLVLGGGLETIGRHLKRRIRAATGLTASVGMGPNKLIAKIASRLGKPDGFVHIRPGEIREKLDPMPVAALWGIGPRTCARLERAGIVTVKQLRLAPPALLQAIFGRFAETYRRLAAGDDPRPVCTDVAERSISAEETFAVDLVASDDMKKRLLDLAETVGVRLRERGLTATVITIKLRRGDFTTQTRQRRFKPGSSGTRLLYRVASELLDRWLDDNPHASIRLLGLAASGFIERGQLDLFAGAESPQHRVDTLVDEVRGRFGVESLARATLMRESRIQTQLTDFIEK